MGFRIQHCLVVLAAFAARLQAQLQAQNISCGSGERCPSGLPCCSPEGQCGVGAYCLGGCDPANSYELDSCVPAPACRSQTYKLSDTSNIISVVNYLGDASKHGWVSTGQIVPYDSYQLLTMREGSLGSMLSSSAYVWYGKLTVTLKTSAGAGVVTDILLLADSGDEIAFEFVGADTMKAQTNFYFQGINNDHQINSSLSDTSQQFHTYEIDWKPDTIDWSIDGKIVRTLNREDTWSANYNAYAYPQTPARVQLILWPGGLASNTQATIDWAGGLIDWNSSLMAHSGDSVGTPYYFAEIDSVAIQCYDPASGVNVTGDKSYIYNSNVMTNNTVEITNRDTVIDSLEGTGTNPDGGNVPSGTVSLADGPTNTDGNTFTQGDGANNSGSSGMSTGDKVGIGVGVPLGVIAIGVIAFFLLRRRRRRRPVAKARRDSGQNNEKPELAAEYDPTVAGPVKPKSELPNGGPKRKELSSGWLPPELGSSISANASWSHTTGGYVPPELHSTSITGAGSSNSNQVSRSISRKPIASTSTSSQPPATTPALSSDTSQPLQSPQSPVPAEELAEEADVVVQEMGLVNMRKKALKSEATTKGIQPDALQGRKGAEYQKLLKRESSLRERLDEIERERTDMR